jgi:hypothetical protein
MRECAVPIATAIAAASQLRPCSRRGKVTSLDGNTSEFSAPAAYSPPAVGGIVLLPDVGDSLASNYVALAARTGLVVVALTAGA